MWWGGGGVVVRCGGRWGVVVIRKTMPRVMRNGLTSFSKTYNVVFNTILHGFYYHFTPASAVNVCYRRSQSWLTGGVDLDEVVAFATVSGSSTHHTQSPNHNLTPIPTQPDLTSSPTYITLSNQPFQTTPSHTSSYSPIQTSHLSSTHSPIHKHTDAYTFNCKQIINFIYFY